MAQLPENSRHTHRPHPEFATGFADPQRMKRVVHSGVVGTEVGNFLGAYEPDPELDRGTLEHPRLLPDRPGLAVERA
jgi:hypothetical protein